MGHELEHIHRGDLNRVLADHGEELLQVERHGAACSAATSPPRTPDTRSTSRTSPDPDTLRTRHGKMLIAAPSHCQAPHGCHKDHPGIWR
jgi:hypothetical protein